MTFINYASREINCKIVYYGPGLCGKVDNLQFIYDKTKPDAKGKLISLATETDRTLFFDFLPLELGNVRGFKTRFHLYTVPGQIFYDASRTLILKGVDGVVFVADSQRERMDANVESLRNLEQNLKAQGYDIRSIPYVLQLNKRDLPSALPVDEIKAKLCIGTEPVLEAIANSEEGIGVFDTLKAVAKLILLDLTKTSAEEVRHERASEIPFKMPSGARVPPYPRSELASPEEEFYRGRRRWVFARYAFPILILIGLVVLLVVPMVSSFVADPEGAKQAVAVYLAPWVSGVVGALWIHHRNRREEETRDAFRLLLR
jgi:signal recognition particle receptor subunit beta